MSDVDLLDGVNLALLRTLVAVFEAAHEADPAIPRITFNALRAHVHRSHHVAPPAAAGGPAAGASA